MGDFAAAWRKTSGHEAGYADHAADKGGETWCGIARRFWPAWPGWSLIDAEKHRLGLTHVQLRSSSAARKVLEQALRQLPELQRMVEDFYRVEFWQRLRLDGEPDQRYAEKLFDIGVNMGDPRAAEFDRRVREAVG